MKFHEDDRAQRIIDVFDHMKGQVNVSYVNSTEHVVAWHKHNKQTDYWICLKGSFKVGIATKGEDDKQTLEWVYLSDKNFRVLKIPPGIYHGYKAMEKGSILLYNTDRKYDPEDEIRAEIGSFGDIWNTVSR